VTEQASSRTYFLPAVPDALRWTGPATRPSRSEAGVVARAATRAPAPPPLPLRRWIKSKRLRDPADAAESPRGRTAAVESKRRGRPRNRRDSIRRRRRSNTWRIRPQLRIESPPASSDSLSPIRPLVDLSPPSQVPSSPSPARGRMQHPPTQDRAFSGKCDGLKAVDGLRETRGQLRGVLPVRVGKCRAMCRRLRMKVKVCGSSQCDCRRELSQQQNKDAGYGMTSAVLVADELLRREDGLVQLGTHPSAPTF
jgi:hypothetical protein